VQWSSNKLPVSRIVTAVRPFQLLSPQSGALSQISSGTRPSVQTVCLKRICLLDTTLWLKKLDRYIFKLEGTQRVHISAK